MSVSGFYKMFRSMKGSLSLVEVGMLDCLVSDARWQKHSIGKGDRLIRRGQLITSAKSFAEEWSTQRRTVESCWKKLVEKETIHIETIGKKKRITVLNYSKYQDLTKSDAHTDAQVDAHTDAHTDAQVDAHTDAHTDAHIASESTPENRTLDPSKKGRKEEGKKLRKEEGKNVNRDTAIARVSLREPHTSHDIDLGSRWAEWTASQWPHLKANADTYANAIAKVRKATKLQDAELDFIFTFIVGDPFWSPNCQSPAGLLKLSKNGVRKIDNILASMKGKYSNEIELAKLNRIIEQKKSGTFDEQQKQKKEYIF